MRTSLSILIQFGLIGGGGFITKSCPTLVTWWTVAHQTPLSMGFSRQEYWNGLPFYSPGDLPNPGLLYCRWIILLTEPSGKPFDWLLTSLWVMISCLFALQLIFYCIPDIVNLVFFFFLSLHLWALSSVAVKLVRNNFVLFSNSVSLVFKIFRQDWSHA